MEFLSEDPTYLAGGLGLIAVGLLIALRVSQQGKYLIGALVALGLAAVVLLVEWLWVTDNERIEAAVYDLAQRGRAVGRAGGTRSDDVRRSVRQWRRGARRGRRRAALIEHRIAGAKFDFVRVTQLRTHAGGQSRRGSAEFRVIAGGSVDGPVTRMNFGTANSAWSLGFRETNPGVWKVDRIAPTSAPGLSEMLPGPTGTVAPIRGRRFGIGLDRDRDRDR